MARSIFLTGASGFLGRRLLYQIAAGRVGKVVCLCRSKLAEPQLSNVDCVLGDLLNHASYAEKMTACDTVVHLAAATGKHSPDEYFRVNRDGTQILVKAARRAGIRRFLYVSTIAVKFPDKSRYHYAQSKEQAEAIVKVSGLDWTIVRPTMILGRHAPVLDGLSRLAVLPIVLVFGDGRTLVQPIFVDDLAASLIAILENRGWSEKIVEIGGPQVLSIEDLLLNIRRTLGRESARVIHVPAHAVNAALGWLEPVFRCVLPISGGQLASFTNPGTVTPDSWVETQQARMKDLAGMLSV